MALIDKLKNSINQFWSNRILPDFRSMAISHIILYRRHKTKAKLSHLIMNLPLGAFIDEGEIKKIHGINTEELIDLITKKERILVTIKEE